MPACVWLNQQAIHVRPWDTIYRQKVLYKRNKTRYKETDVHKPCSPSVGIWKPMVETLPTSSNPADRGCAEQSRTIRPSGLAAILGCDNNEGEPMVIAISE